ncbi:unnamed protein product [Auanema sp. JU1783]|nr:unnamed protein product [Auanema sp. JU1783]
MIRFVFLVSLIYLSNSEDFFQIAESLPNTGSIEPHGCYNYAPCKQPKSSGFESPISCPAGQCQCYNGTSGEYCETGDDLCQTEPCLPLGPNFACYNSLSSYECKCKDNWTGDDCDIDASTACRHEPCVNGVCESSSDSDYTCTNCGGKLGKNCQYNDPCVSSTCANGATCQVLFDGQSFKCQCTPGFQNRNCDARSDVYENPATNLGCIDWDDKFMQFKVCSDIEPPVTPTKCAKCLETQTDTSYKFFGVSGTLCRLGKNVNTLNMTVLTPDAKCNTNCGSSEKCGTISERIWIYEHVSTYKDSETTLASKCLNGGVPYAIIDKTNVQSGTRCICPKPFTGDRCETDYQPCDNADVCNEGTCQYINYEERTFECVCPSDRHGDKCDLIFACDGNECKHGSSCVDTNNNDYKCECLPYYYGPRCENLNYCQYNDMCVNGKCKNTGDNILVDFLCECEPGWEGTYCDEDINDCDPNPCMFDGICTDKFLGFDCDCVTGTEGVNCSINIDDCKPPPCNTKDEDAICIDGINEYTCSCSSSWTDVICDLHVLIRDVLITFYGETSDRTMLPLLNDLMSNPTQIKDMVPFIIGMLTYEERVDLSWTSAELFEWVAFENKKLDIAKDFVCWNDVVLGNCFTFNNYSDGRQFMQRSSGEFGGLHALLNIQSAETLPWLETSAIMVFVHDRKEYIFSESVRYNAEPDSAMQLFVSDKRYERLSGVYGKCVKDPSEVDAYFYDGMYTTDGCLRSCYQIMVKEKCGCMDPRYPIPMDEKSCQVADMSCIENATATAGDPTTWPWCVCPLPCGNQQYSVQWSRSGNSDTMPSCGSACDAKANDLVLVSVFMRENEYQTYVEQPAMDLNRFISNLGGLLGVLMGISIISFIEILIMIFTVVYYCISG